MASIGRCHGFFTSAGGIAAILGLYWDDAWHTDVGRDGFLSPPHLLLYAGVAVLLVVAVAWSLPRWRAEGPKVWRDPAVLLPLLGAGVTLGAAPIDELWHQLFGRDAVVWSPPHLVAVAGMFAFAAGLFLAIHHSGRAPAIAGPVVGAFLIAAAVTTVMEFEADVPQFPIWSYWPVLLGALSLSFGLIRRGSGSVWAATQAALAYVVLRIVVLGFLAGLGHSLPTVMPTVVAAVGFDVVVRRGAGRLGVALVTGVATVASHWIAHHLQPAGLTFAVRDVVLGGVLGLVVVWLAVAATGTGQHAGRPTRPQRAAVLSLLLVTATGWPAPALAHDPGQGEGLLPITLRAERVAGEVTVTATVPSHDCTLLEPGRLVARRAGQVRTAPLTGSGCRYTGTIMVDDAGLWFVYAELTVAGLRAESWAPVRDGSITKDTELYVAPARTSRLGQVAAGIVLYLVVLAILTAVVRTYRRAAVPVARGTVVLGVEPLKVSR
jgi:hypothetical protein